MRRLHLDKDLESQLDMGKYGGRAFQAARTFSAHSKAKTRRSVKLAKNEVGKRCDEVGGEGGKVADDGGLCRSLK